MQSGG